MTVRRARARRRALAVGVIGVIFVALLAGALLLTQESDDDSDLTDVTLFMGFIPSVQFAPFYVAAERGYFADEGIAIDFEHGNETDGLDRIATGDLQFGMVSGEQVLLARSQDRPVVYIFEWYHNFPVGIVSPADLDITTPEDLAGRVVGIPGQYGASYVGLLALLEAAGMEQGDLGELRSIGFAAPENICEERVEAAVVYIANEPLTIEQSCTPVNVISVSDYTTLVSNGLVTNEDTIRNDPELVRSMVRAAQRGLQDVFADPAAAFEISLDGYVSDLPASEYDTQRQVLLNSIDIWRSDDLGRTDPTAWERTHQILIDAGLLAAPLDDLTAAYDMQFLPDDN